MDIANQNVTMNVEQMNHFANNSFMEISGQNDEIYADNLRN